MKCYNTVLLPPPPPQVPNHEVVRDIAVVNDGVFYFPLTPLAVSIKHGCSVCQSHLPLHLHSHIAHHLPITHLCPFHSPLFLTLLSHSSLCHSPLPSNFSPCHSPLPSHFSPCHSLLSFYTSPVTYPYAPLLPLSLILTPSLPPVTHPYPLTLPPVIHP